MSDGKANVFLAISVIVLLLNFVSQIAAFPFQCALIIYAIVKSDIKLFPGLFIAVLDKSDFTVFHATVIKFNFGFSMGPGNLFLIGVFLMSLIGVFRKIYDSDSLTWILPWMTCVVPALAMALPARQLGLASVWQTPIIQFLTPGVYFWAISVGKTWDSGCRYFVEKMVLVLTSVNVLEALNIFNIFTFSEHVTMLSFCVSSFILNLGVMTRIVAVLGGAFAVFNLAFGRYFSMLETAGYTSVAELGSTFTRLMVVVFGVMLMWCFTRRFISKRFLRAIPYMAFVGCLVIFIYAVARARTTKMSDSVEKDYRSFLERFEFKLIGDRGALWSESLDLVFEKPLFFKNLKNQMVSIRDSKTGGTEFALRILPHNQVLSLLVREGWWLGLFLVFFIWRTHVKAFAAASYMINDRALMCTLLAPSAAVFIAVGLTGQSVVHYIFCSNGMVTLAYPGIIYGTWQMRKRFFER